jgi:hypothetical protein
MNCEPTAPEDEAEAKQAGEDAPAASDGGTIPPPDLPPWGTPEAPLDFLPPPLSVPLPPPLTALKLYPPPEVNEITPRRGTVLGDTKITLAGANLFRTSIVRIGGLIAQTVGADEPRELRVLTPAGGRPGEVDITIENPFVPPLSLEKAFRYEALAPPRIAGVAPDRVATKGGTEVTVTGEGFVKSTLVLIDGEPAEGAVFVSATTIDATAPAGEDGRLVDVTVKNPDGQMSVARRAFVYDRRFG